MDSFDPESGQVYRETVVRRPLKAHRAWEHDYKGRKPYNVLSPRGADSLTAMVLRKLVCHADQLRPDTLAALPAHTAHQIRTAIRRQGCETLSIWKAFAEAGHEDKTFKFCASTSTHHKPLVNFFLDLVSPNFSWMVDLDLVDVYCSPIDLRQLASCSNLMSLQIRYKIASGQEPFDDEVIRSLAHRAISDNSLSKLRMLFVANTLGITPKSFNHIRHLPALKTFCVMGTSIGPWNKAQWNDNGWYQSSGSSSFSTYAKEQSLRAGYHALVSRLSFTDLARGYIQQCRSSLSDGDWNLPSVDVSFGPESSTPHCYMAEVRCFERDREVERNKRKHIAHHSPVGTHILKTTKEPTTKKRKLKSGRTIGLNEMLEGL